MKITLDKIHNVLFALACLVIIALGGLELWARLVPQPARQARSSPPPVESVQGVEIRTGQAATLVRGTPKVALIEVADFQCPFCAKYATETYARIRREYVDTGRIAYVFLNFPLEQIHPLALDASEATECAGEQGKYWDMRERIFANQDALGENDLSSHASALGLDLSRFKVCLDGKTIPRIREQMKEARQAGVRSTPTFLIGQIDEDQKIRVTTRLRGAQKYEAYRDALDAAIQRSTTQATNRPSRSWR